MSLTDNILLANINDSVRAMYEEHVIIFTSFFCISTSLLMSVG